MKAKFYLVILVTLVIFLGSCKEDEKKDQDIVVDNKIEQLVYPVPTPFEVTQMLQKAGASYRLDLVNDVKNAEKYFKEKSQALNLGIYGADLAYASTYNQAQSIREILTATQRLANELGLTNVIDQNTITRVEQNIEKADSLYKIVNNSYLNTFNKLNEENKGAVSLMIITGAWIESIYISTQLAITSQNSSIIMEKIAQQKFTVNSLIPLLQQHKDNQDIADVIVIVEKFKTIFDKVAQNEEGDVKMDAKVFEELTKLAESERKAIITLN